MDREAELSRKFRLFIVACCTRVAHLHAEVPDFLNLAAQFADQLITPDDMDRFNAARRIVVEDDDLPLSPTPRQVAAFLARWAATLSTVAGKRNPRTGEWSPTQTIITYGCLEDASRYVACAFAWGATGSTNLFQAGLHPSIWYDIALLGEQYRTAAQEFAYTEERKIHSRLLREIIGNPFRTIRQNPAWLTAAVRTLAQSAYDERDLRTGTLNRAHLASLVDALEVAGCENAELLGHLRSPDPHVRGCFVVDSVLGKK